MEQLKRSVIKSIEKTSNDSFEKTKYAIEQIVTNKEREIDKLTEKSICYTIIKVKTRVFKYFFYIFYWF